MRNIKLNVKNITLFASLILVLSTSLAWGYNQNYRGEIVSFFKSVHVSSEDSVSDVVSIFGDVWIDGEVRQDVVAIFGNVVVNGNVNSDVIAIFGGITVTKNAKVNRDAISILGHGITNDGVIYRDRINVMGIMPVGAPPIGILFILLATLILIKQILAYILSVVAVLFFNDRFDRMATNINFDIGKKALIGLLVYFGAFVLAAILVIIVIGVPLVVLLIPALSLVEFAGNTTAKLAIGRGIGKRIGNNWSIMLELLVGTIVYILIEITIIGKLFTMALKFVGMGEVVDSRFGEVKIPPAIPPKGDFNPNLIREGNDKNAE
ncbi:hypothetical protein [Alkaliphilus peptidifermentans]|uniref:Polymer-forming protein n=1 Tax=Alkaliphilus peptidifermentans DSM 18978 TaxID=1120976 RepID=A0A1G5IEK9_9FIRM|nr:hypothetical protein [Alkaliphilus peptidifermentans]SCY73999.1 hypothetical protein SAMN03080606_02353 [Alkaliphilus peptidifermentans DSM 18978]